jgi:hypothetical protein
VTLPSGAATSETVYKRLAEVAVELERHAAAIWLLEREREELRSELRRLNAIPRAAA